MKNQAGARVEPTKAAAAVGRAVSRGEDSRGTDGTQRTGRRTFGPRCPGKAYTDRLCRGFNHRLLRPDDFCLSPCCRVCRLSPAHYAAPIQALLRPSFPVSDTRRLPESDISLDFYSHQPKPPEPTGRAGEHEDAGDARSDHPAPECPPETDPEVSFLEEATQLERLVIQIEQFIENYKESTRYSHN